MFGVVFDSIRKYVCKDYYLKMQETILPLSIEQCFISNNIPKGDVDNSYSKSKIFRYETKSYDCSGNELENISFKLTNISDVVDSSIVDDEKVQTTITYLIDSQSDKKISALIQDKVFSVLLAITNIRKDFDIFSNNALEIIKVINLLNNNIHSAFESISDDDITVAMFTKLFSGAWESKNLIEYSINKPIPVQMLVLNGVPLLTKDVESDNVVYMAFPDINKLIVVTDSPFFMHVIKHIKKISKQ